MEILHNLRQKLGAYLLGPWIRPAWAMSENKEAMTARDAIVCIAGYGFKKYSDKYGYNKRSKESIISDIALRDMEIDNLEKMLEDEQRIVHESSCTIRNQESTIRFLRRKLSEAKRAEYAVKPKLP